MPILRKRFDKYVAYHYQALQCILWRETSENLSTKYRDIWHHLGPLFNHARIAPDRIE